MLHYVIQYAVVGSRKCNAYCRLNTLTSTRINAILYTTTHSTRLSILKSALKSLAVWLALSGLRTSVENRCPSGMRSGRGWTYLTRALCGLKAMMTMLPLACRILLQLLLIALLFAVWICPLASRLCLNIACKLIVYQMLRTVLFRLGPSAYFSAWRLPALDASSDAHIFCPLGLNPKSGCRNVYKDRLQINDTKSVSPVILNFFLNKTIGTENSGRQSVSKPLQHSQAHSTALTSQQPRCPQHNSSELFKLWRWSNPKPKAPKPSLNPKS